MTAPDTYPASTEPQPEPTPEELTAAMPYLVQLVAEPKNINPVSFLVRRDDAGAA